MKTRVCREVNSSDNVFLLITLIALIVVGCAAPKVRMYPGPELEPNKQAVIRVDAREGKPGILSIPSVDDEMTVNFFKFFFNGAKYAGEVYVLPGKHKILTKMNNGLSFAHQKLWLIAEPGETYILKAVLQGYSVSMWLENERTGLKTGGIVGSDDEPKE